MAFDAGNFRGHLPIWVWIFLIIVTAGCLLVFNQSQEGIRKAALVAGMFALINLIIFALTPMPSKSIYWLAGQVVKRAIQY